MSLVSNIVDLATRVATEFNTVRTEIAAGGGGTGTKISDLTETLELDAGDWIPVVHGAATVKASVGTISQAGRNWAIMSERFYL